MLEGSTSIWTWDGGLYHLPHVLGHRGDLLAHRPEEDRIRRAVASARYGATNTRARCRAGRIRCCSASACGWTPRQASLNRMLDAFEDEETFREDLRQILPSRSSTSPGSSSSGTAPTIPSRASWRTASCIGQTWDGPALSPEEGRQAGQLSGAEGRRDHLDRRLCDAEGGQERRSGLCVPQLPPHARRPRRWWRRARATIRSSSAPTSCCPIGQEEFAEAYPGDVAEEAVAAPAGAVLVRRTARNTPTSSSPA